MASIHILLSEQTLSEHWFKLNYGATLIDSWTGEHWPSWHSAQRPWWAGWGQRPVARTSDIKRWEESTGSCTRWAEERDFFDNLVVTIFGTPKSHGASVYHPFHYNFAVSPPFNGDNTHLDVTSQPLKWKIRVRTSCFWSWFVRSPAPESLRSKLSTVERCMIFAQVGDAHIQSMLQQWIACMNTCKSATIPDRVCLPQDSVYDVYEVYDHCRTVLVLCLSQQVESNGNSLSEFPIGR